MAVADVAPLPSPGLSTPLGPPTQPGAASLGANTLTQEEKMWMSQLLKACRSKGVIVKDRFELAMYAIVFKGNVEKAVGRLSKLREFEATNDLDSLDPEVAGKLIEELHPNSLLSCGVDKEGRQVIFFDGAAFKPAKMTSEYHWRCMMKAMLMTMPLWTPTIKDIREGITVVQKVDGMGMEQFSLSSHKKLTPIFGVSAVKIKCLILLNPNLVMRFFTGAAKMVLSKKMGERLHVVRGEEELTSQQQFIANDQLAKEVGGSFPLSLVEWAQSRHEVLEGTRRELGPL